jgi:monovalent cation/hydrogen antiporter
MILFEWVLGILRLCAAMPLARQIRGRYPALLALGGAMLAFIAGAPCIVLEPEPAPAIIVAPVLLDAA